ncbi:MAG: response regulator [Caldilineaceae bacterium]
MPRLRVISIRRCLTNQRLPDQKYKRNLSNVTNAVSPRARILVVEDNVDLNMAICEILESFNFEVNSSKDGFDALDWLKDNTPDMILCDIMMPGMDGYTLLKHARADTKLRTLPFIFLTARTSVADRRMAKEIGIEDYLTKPVDSNDLIAAINNALRRRQIMQDEMQEQMNALRDRIVGILQHEFRTPLTFVLGYAEYLLDVTKGEFNVDELRTSATAILDGGRRLQQLIETFLLLAELQNRQLDPAEIGRVSAYQLLHDLTQEFRTRCMTPSLRSCWMGNSMRSISMQIQRWCARAAPVDGQCNSLSPPRIENDLALDRSGPHLDLCWPADP